MYMYGKLNMLFIIKYLASSAFKIYIVFDEKTVFIIDKFYGKI